MFKPSVVTLQLWLLIFAVFGPLAAWRYEPAGAITALVSLAGFYLANFIASGRFPGGWLFPTLSLAPLFYLMAWSWQRARLRGK